MKVAFNDFYLTFFLTKKKCFLYNIAINCKKICYQNCLFNIIKFKLKKRDYINNKYKLYI